MLRSSVEDNLHRLWMLYVTKRDDSYLRDYLKIFKTTFKDLLDPEFQSLSENTVPNASDLPILHEKLLPLLDTELQSVQEVYMQSSDIDSLYHAEDLVKCLTIILRNGENISAVGQRAFVMKLVVLCTIVLSKLSSENVDYDDQMRSFVHSCLHFFECLYDPYFLWRKRLRGWVNDKSRMKYAAASLHIEVVPFLYDFLMPPKSFKKIAVDVELHKHLFHVFGALILGSNDNAVKAICPAMIDVLLHTLARETMTVSGTGADRRDSDDGLAVKELAINVFIAMVQVLVLKPSSKKEVEVGNVMEGFFQTLLRSGNEVNDAKLQLLLLGAIERMLTTDCREKLQPVFVCEGIFDTIVAFLHKIEVTGNAGDQVQSVAIAAVSAIQAILSESRHAKDFFMEKIGYARLAAAMQRLGAPSRELLHALLDMIVEGHFEDGKVNALRNAHAAVMLVQWLPDIESHDLQTWLAHCLVQLARGGKYNQIICCDAGMLKAILDTCSLHHKLHSGTLIHLLELLHTLGSLSITASELKQLIRLLRDDDEKPFPNQSRLMSGLAIMARRNGMEGALHYFDFCAPVSGIMMPAFRKWPGVAFTFHAWLCLYSNLDIRETTSTARRMLYSFTTNSGGFESFLTLSGALVVAVYNKKEYLYISTSECRLQDDLWHCVDVVHIPSKHLLGHSLINIFIDGKLVVTAEMKLPPLTETFTSCHISMPSVPNTLPSKKGEELTLPTDSGSKHTSPMSKFFSSALKPFSSAPAMQVSSLPAGDQHSVFGDSLSMLGSLGSCCVLCDVLTEAQVKNLYSVGPNSLTLSDDEKLADLVPKLVVYYNAKASCDNQCIDLSTNDYHGSLVQSQICVTQDVKDVINSIGGVQVLWPLLERSLITNSAPSPCQLCESRQGGALKSNDSSLAAKGAEGSHNTVTLFLILLHNLLHDSPTNQDTLMREGAVATLGMLMLKVDAATIDGTVLTTIQMICDSVQDNHLLSVQIHQYLIFDFRLWTRSEASVQIAHIQYLATIVKDLRREYRKKYGVQYFLDVIRQHYKFEEGCKLTVEECVTIRKALLGLVRFYISKEITVEELRQILSFIFIEKRELLVCEAMDMLIGLLDSPMRRDQLFLLLYEADTGELLYNLFTLPECPVSVKERAIKIIGLLLKSDCVYEKSKSRLRLLETGLFSGMTYFMRGLPLSVTLAKALLDHVSAATTVSSLGALLSLLLLFQETDVDIKIDASKRVMSMVMSSTATGKLLVEQQGWQEAIVGLLCLRRRSSRRHQSSLSQSDADLASMDRQSTCSEASSGNGPLALSIGNNILPAPDYTVDSPMYDKNFDYSIDPNQNILSDVPPSFGRQVSTMSTYSDSGVLEAPGGSEVGSVSGGMTSSRSMPVNLATSQRRMSRQSGDRALQDTMLSLPLPVAGFEGGGQLEELCQNVLLALYTLTTRGIDGHSKAAWKERGQVVTAIQYVGETHDLPYPTDCIVRRLLEMMMQGLLADVKNIGYSSAVDGVRELVRLLYHFLCVDDASNVKRMRTSSGDRVNMSRFSERIIEDLMSLFDLMVAWENGNASRELEQLGFSILLAFIAQNELSLVSLAAAKLNTLLQTRPTEKMMQSCYIMAEVDSLLQKAIAVNSNEHYGCLMPLMKTLADQCKHLLNMETYVPNLPAALNSVTFMDDYRVYSQSEEWISFMKKQVLPSKEQYVATIYDELKIQIKTFVGECHEQMMLSNHYRNRERGESKLYFQTQITEPFNRQAAIESKRHMGVLSRQRSQLAAAQKQWKQMKSFLTSERGVWPDRKSETLHWKLAMQENLQRMRPKLIPNCNFTLHTEASRLRDNLGSEEEEQMANMLARVALRKYKVEDTDEETIADEDWAVISAEANQAQPADENAKEKLVLTEECEMVTMMEVIKGRLEVTTSNIYFFDLSPNREEGAEDYRWSLSELREVLFRRYNLRRSALEIFLTDQTNYFLNFSKKTRNKVYTKILSLHPPNLIYYGSRSPAELLKSSGLTQKWVQREISNFEYLMQLNTLAGRTYNDLSQYPVFPWILQDYTSKILNLDDPAVFRDLSRPIGVVNKNNEKEVREKYENFEDPSGTVEKFHYGTHYSNAAGVMHYLVRLEPFTSYHIQLQSNRFDVADRQFHSLPATWQMLMESPNDVKELIPEFFFLPEFLENLNGFDLGKLQFSHERVDSVVLPPWASSAEDFIYKHMMALESEYVSQHLHEWIDLIFGYKQKGPAAVEALNVFYYVTYEGAVDLDAITDPFEAKALEGMINNFGQTPSQLLKEPHPRRLTLQEMMARAIKADRPTSVLPFLDQLKTFYVTPYVDGDPVVYVALSRSQARSLLPGTTESLVTLCQSGTLGVHGWLPYDKNITNYFTFEKDITLASPRLKRKLGGPFAPGHPISAKLFATLPDGKLIVSGGHWDNSLRVFSMAKNKTVAHLVRHTDIVTCVSCDTNGSRVISGSKDTTCLIWQVVYQSGVSQGLAPKPLLILYGHDDEVTCVAISLELDVAVSSSKDGTVIVHSAKKGSYLRTLRPPCDPGLVVSIHSLALSDLGQMCVYCTAVSATRTVKEEFQSLHVFSVNGKHLFAENVNVPISHFTISGSHLVIGNQQGVLIVKELYNLKTLISLPLGVAVTALAVTPGNSHFLIGLRDGKLIVVGARRACGGLVK